MPADHTWQWERQRWAPYYAPSHAYQPLHFPSSPPPPQHYRPGPLNEGHQPRGRRRGADHPLLKRLYPDGVRVIGADDGDDFFEERPGKVVVKGGAQTGSATEVGGAKGGGGNGYGTGGVGGGGARPEEAMDEQMKDGASFLNSLHLPITATTQAAQKLSSSTPAATALLLHPLPVTLSRSSALSILSPFFPTTLEAYTHGPSSSSGIKVVLPTGEAKQVVAKAKRGELIFKDRKVEVSVLEELGGMEEMQPVGGEKDGRSAAGQARVKPPSPPEAPSTAQVKTVIRERTITKAMSKLSLTGGVVEEDDERGRPTVVRSD
ncbi:hypothetical protein JCM8097_003506 [Rhodosporidiobolus ruineniae]